MADSTEQAYHTSAYQTAGMAMMSFAPINGIHQHLCAFHCYSDEPSRSVKAHHFCRCLNEDLHQCIIFDSDQKDARLIGIEYILSEKKFATLPAEEKRYWHSHQYEVESGLLQLVPKAGIPISAVDVAERPAMLHLRKTYGKTIHTWQYDKYPDIPLGPPTLMASYTGPGQIGEEKIKERDQAMGMDTEKKRQLRKEYMEEDGWRAQGAGQDGIWEGKDDAKVSFRVV